MAEKQKPEATRLYGDPAIYTGAKDRALQIGGVLTTLARLFGKSSDGHAGPGTMLMVETTPGAPLRQAAETMAGTLREPLIIADAEFGIDEVQGTPVGRIESTGDSLFRKIAGTPPGVLFIEGAEQMRPNNRKIMGHLLDGKPLTLPGMDKPVDLKGWTVVLTAPRGADVAEDLKNRASATVDLGQLQPRP